MNACSASVRLTGKKWSLDEPLVEHVDVAVAESRSRVDFAHDDAVRGTALRRDDVVEFEDVERRRIGNVMEARGNAALQRRKGGEVCEELCSKVNN